MKDFDIFTESFKLQGGISFSKEVKKKKEYITIAFNQESRTLNIDLENNISLSQKITGYRTDDLKNTLMRDFISSKVRTLLYEDNTSSELVDALKPIINTEIHVYQYPTISQLLKAFCIMGQEGDFDITVNGELQTKQNNTKESSSSQRHADRTPKEIRTVEELLLLGEEYKTILQGVGRVESKANAMELSNIKIRMMRTFLTEGLRILHNDQSLSTSKFLNQKTTIKDLEEYYRSLNTETKFHLYSFSINNEKDKIILSWLSKNKADQGELYNILHYLIAENKTTSQILELLPTNIKKQFKESEIRIATIKILRSKIIEGMKNNEQLIGILPKDINTGMDLNEIHKNFKVIDKIAESTINKDLNKAERSLLEELIDKISLLEDVFQKLSLQSEKHTTGGKLAA